MASFETKHYRGFEIRWDPKLGCRVIHRNGEDVALAGSISLAYAKVDDLSNAERYVDLYHRCDWIYTEEMAQLASTLGLEGGSYDRYLAARKIAGQAWALALDGLRFHDCRAVIVEHYQRSTDWIMPKHVIDAVRRLRDKRLHLAGDLDPAGRPGTPVQTITLPQIGYQR